MSSPSHTFTLYFLSFFYSFLFFKSMRLQLSSKLLLIFLQALLLLLCTVDCQSLPLEISNTSKEPSKTPASTTPPVIVPTVAPSSTTTTTTTTVAPPPPPPSSSAPTTTTLSTLAPSSSASSSIVLPPSTTTTVASSSARPSSTTTTLSSTSSSSSTTTSTKSATSSAPSASNSLPSQPQDTTPIIVGSVVGGVVGLALIGGIIACISRRGGCTKRRDRKKKPEFEDYGLGDFPPHQNIAPAATVTAATKPLSPTIPRLNDQGNYYNEDYNNYGYQQGDYGMQNPQHGGYYYPQMHQQEYYDDNGYYYDTSSGMGSTAVYSPQQPMHQGYNAQGYAPNNMVPQGVHQQDIYKPDDTKVPVHTGGGQSK
ncbi:unnamed protein product [Rhizopus microsporus]